MPLDQRGDVRVVGPGEHIALPMTRHSATFGFGQRSRIDTNSTIWPCPRPVVAPLAGRICRRVRKCAMSSFLSTPRDWMKRLR